MSEPITPPSTPDEFNKTNNNDLIFQPNLSPTPTLKPSVSKSTATSIKESVQVLVRCRPPSERERLERPCWYVRPEEGSIELLQIKNPTSGYSFHYDKVIEGVDNSQVYKAGIQELVRSAMKGYNGTVFAYGQTASGKTYVGSCCTEQEPGVTPRAVEEVFSYINTDTSGREYMLRVSYMEIYNEKMKDLFNPKDGQPEIVEDKKQITVRNLKEHIVKTPQEVMEFIKEGEKNRHVSATDYNEQSSRSHSIFQIVIESRSPHELTQVRLSQLNLIDLAGSEKVTSDMERRMEGSYINKSLLTLGNVISKLTSDEPVTHIPFRNSKLTRILQTALSGNARIAVICTINPTFASKDESLNTLRFAQRAKLVKTAAKMTSIMDKSELKKCLIKIAELQTQMREKTELEVATRESLKNLLGLILTGSKEEEQKGLVKTNNYFRIYFIYVSINSSPGWITSLQKM
ncbi:kinesin-domain-containing protein [Backusella circina FSU 941]|nr:kinesin-domain-containing protein [Backusella circina FSU 941]